VALFSSFWATSFYLITNRMEDLKLLLIDRLKSKGMDPSLISAVLKARTILISADPGIEPVVANQKMQRKSS
jgi:hypothetical protein